MAENMGQTKEEIASLKRTSALEITKQYKRGTLKTYNSYKTRRASAMVSLLEKK